MDITLIDIAINHEGELCLVWGWDAGSDAELVYSIQPKGTWSAPKRLPILIGASRDFLLLMWIRPAIFMLSGIKGYVERMKFTMLDWRTPDDFYIFLVCHQSLKRRRKTLLL